ncbi:MULTISPECIES: MFS transporter [unclassified Frankia]|uniref:MFS transporter n=1 Tax=unclassified Frankia TaxID=2632575 RepID=UPI0027DD5FF1|nr:MULTISPECIES: MFS transporter [unclassified Frankia]
MATDSPTGAVGRVRASLGTGVGRIRATTRRDGADRSGLAALLDLSVINAAGDALVTVALAGSLFFSVPTGQARSKVALYLLITMVPFVLLAPVIGPLLDRVAHGRRTALAALCLGRCLLAWQLAAQLSGLQVYPLALGLLMLSRAFGIARSAVIPRVAPPGLTLVKVNSRMSMVNIVASSAVAPIGLGIAHIPYVGYAWVLRLCALLYLAGVLLAINLPKRVDSNAGERALRDIVAGATGPRAAAAPSQPVVAGPPYQAVAGTVVDSESRGRRLAGKHARWHALVRAVLGASPVALRSTLVLRAIVGFLTFFLAFLLRTEGGTNLWLGALAASAAIGSGLGVVIGGRLGRRRPERILTLALLLTTVGCLLAAIDYAKFPALFAALLAMLAAAMAKLALDAIIQRDTADDVRNSAFARSETVLQLGWVAGGALGLIEMPGQLGFLIAGLVPAAALLPQAREIRRARGAADRAERLQASGGDPAAWPAATRGTWVAPDGTTVLPAMMPPPDRPYPAVAGPFPDDATRPWRAVPEPPSAPAGPVVPGYPSVSPPPAAPPTLWYPGSGEYPGSGGYAVPGGYPESGGYPGNGGYPEAGAYPAPGDQVAGQPLGPWVRAPGQVDETTTRPARRRPWGRARRAASDADPDTTLPLGSEGRFPEVPPPRNTPNHSAD